MVTEVYCKVCANSLIKCDRLHNLRAWVKNDAQIYATGTKFVTKFNIWRHLSSGARTVMLSIHYSFEQLSIHYSFEKSRVGISCILIEIEMMVSPVPSEMSPSRYRNSGMYFVVTLNRGCFSPRRYSRRVCL